jgi:hypothetical protein
MRVSRGMQKKPLRAKSRRIEMQQLRKRKERHEEKSTYMSANGVQVPLVGRYRCLKGVRRLGTVDNLVAAGKL